MLKTIRINFDRAESRRDQRYPLPPITVTFDAGEYVTSNWSLGGFLLAAQPEQTIGFTLGATVSGQATMPDGRATHAFSAEVVRTDADGTGFRFTEPSGALVGALDRAIANRLFRKRA